MKLFAIYIGGEFEGANIELHDMRFVVAPAIGDTYDTLRRQWWGIPKSLHIDCWAEIDHADGYDVTLRPEPFAGPERLYYVNLGGYAPGEFSERHKNVFVVADSLAKAKARALRSVTGWREAHRDDMFEAEQAFSLADSASEHRLHIHLERADAARDLGFTCDYVPIRARPAR
ncbi:MAG: DUF1543 domain-containing protein [Sphingomonadales bacterium]|nr:MAG: DUF1543 domain-containing protein [Sphingomonadales bacterium]